MKKNYLTSEGILLQRTEERKDFQYNVVGKPKEVDNFPYKRAEFCDNRNILNI